MHLASVSDERFSVLVVAGSGEYEELAVRALAHPRIAVEAANQEETFVAALSTRRFNLAVVGGTIGRCTPRDLCDAIRARQSLPLLVLGGCEPQDPGLAEAPRAPLDDVRELALPAPLADRVEQLIAVGTRLRAEVLDMLQVDEDEGSAERWPQQERQALAAARPGGAVGSGQTPVASEPAVVAGYDPVSVEQRKPAEVGLAPTSDDLEFAARLVDGMRGVDFRAPQPAAGPAVADAVERSTAQLGERVYDLERQLARLAFVYGGRQMELDAAAELSARLSAELSAERQQLAAAQVRASELIAQQLLADEEVKRLREQLQAMHKQQVEREEVVSTLLSQARHRLSEHRTRAAEVTDVPQPRLTEQPGLSTQALHSIEEPELQLQPLGERGDATDQREQRHLQVVPGRGADGPGEQGPQSREPAAADRSATESEPRSGASAPAASRRWPGRPEWMGVAGGWLRARPSTGLLAAAAALTLVTAVVVARGLERRADAGGVDDDDAVEQADLDEVPAELDELPDFDELPSSAAEAALEADLPLVAPSGGRGTQPAPADGREPQVARAEEPTAAVAEPDDARAQGDDERRRALRKKMFNALRRRRWADAVEYGKTLRAGFRLDWEAELRLAQALMQLGRLDEAVAAYEEFLAHHPHTAFADDAHYWCAVMLQQQGKVERARGYYERVAADRQSKLAPRAKKALRRLSSSRRR